MKSSDLWAQLIKELELALQHGEKHESREAFYATARAQVIVDELYFRGQQLLLFEPPAAKRLEALYGMEEGS